MNNQNDNFDWPESEHPELNALLANLGHLKPSEGFADAVMARVPVPQMAAVVQPGRGIRISRRLGWALFGGYSVASAATLAVLVTMIGSGALGFGTMSAGATSMAVSLWHQTASLAVNLLPTSSEFLAVLPALLGLTAALWLIALVSAVGLYRVMNTYSSGRTPINAIR